MRAVKIAAAVMAVLIVLGTTVLVITVVKRLSAPARPVVTATAAAAVEEPAGTTIVGITAVGDRLAVQLRGGGPDRVVFLDPQTALVSGRISFGR
jgi:hypothetical protein